MPLPTCGFSSTTWKKTSTNVQAFHPDSVTDFTPGDMHRVYWEGNAKTKGVTTIPSCCTWQVRTFFFNICYWSILLAIVLTLKMRAIPCVFAVMCHYGPKLYARYHVSSPARLHYMCIRYEKESHWIHGVVIPLLPCVQRLRVGIYVRFFLQNEATKGDYTSGEKKSLHCSRQHTHGTSVCVCVQTICNLLRLSSVISELIQDGICENLVFSISLLR